MNPNTVSLPATLELKIDLTDEQFFQLNSITRLELLLIFLAKEMEEYFVRFYWFNARNWIVIPHSRPGEVSSPSGQTPRRL